MPNQPSGQQQYHQDQRQGSNLQKTDLAPLSAAFFQTRFQLIPHLLGGEFVEFGLAIFKKIEKIGHGVERWL
jgi:hypothetical protein